MYNAYIKQMNSCFHRQYKILIIKLVTFIKAKSTKSLPH